MEIAGEGADQGEPLTIRMWISNFQKHGVLCLDDYLHGASL